MARSAAAPAGNRSGINQGPRFEYTTTPACGGNNPNSGSDADWEYTCMQATQGCQILGAGPGPMIWVWRRPVTSPPAQWVMAGRNCNAATLPATAQPVLTAAMIRRAFEQIQFAVPAVDVQPEGDETLVGLPAYYAVRWPAAGIGPDEITTVQLLGRSVRIRPQARTYTWQYGDGARFGPTTDPGGPYPDGGVNHAYERPGRYPSRVTVTYAGQFSVAGGPWQAVPGTLDLTGPATTVTVHAAKNRLHAD